MTISTPFRMKPADLGKPTYFVLLQWEGNRVAGIRDFYHARYAVECAEVIVAA